MRGGNYLCWACCAFYVGALHAQETPETPSKESNGTAPSTTDQNRTAPATPPAAPSVPVPGSAEDGVPQKATNPKLTEPMPDLLNGVDFGDFIRRNPFNLTRETDKRAEVVVPTTVVPKPIVRLTGMTAFRGKKKVLLEIKLPGAASKPLYHTLEVGDEANGVKVVSIDPKKGEVKLDIKGEESTHSFDSQDDGEIEPFNARGGKGAGSRGPGGRPSRGPGYNRRPTTPKPSGKGKGPLKNIPTRGNRVELLPPGAPLGEIAVHEGRPVFDNVVQTELIVATQINTQREFPRGVVANEPPTDLPFNQR